MNYSDIKLPPLPSPISREIERQYSVRQLEAYAREAVRLNSCKAALTKQQEAEPVAWLCKSKDGQVDAATTTHQKDTYARVGREILPLYLHPPKPAAQPQVPEGFQMVPVEPTPEMKQAALKVDIGDDGDIVLTWEEVERLYRAMLSAAPAPEGDSR